MKKILFLFALLAMSTVGLAQTRTVNGAVIDKNGNPLPGAKVEAEGGIYTTVNADGSFSLEVPTDIQRLNFSYVGIGDRYLKITDSPMLVELKKQQHWFVNLESETVLNDEEAVFLGIRAGYLAENLGGYFRVVVPTLSNFDSENHVPAVTAGLIGRLFGNLYFYGGLGYSKVFAADEMDYRDTDYDGLAVDAGFMCKAGHFNVTVGYGLHTTCSDDKNHCVQFGVGYNF